MINLNLEKKEKLEKMLVGKIAGRINVNPSFLTLLSIFLMLTAACLVHYHLLPYAALFVLLSGFFDMLDGAVAKAHNRTSAFGSFFDKAADRINDMLILGAIVWAGYVPLLLGLFVFGLVVLASYMSAVMDALTKKPIGEAVSLRPIRILVIVAMFLTPYAEAVYYGMWVLLLLGIYAVCERFWKAATMLR